ncbi:hypothetical protein [Prevotella intermedia]|uniref:hypothetical protein n=1 Tax=Prevotella intermedia TaxID=28131 RepID=UPI00077DF498|nr:hypothetical protein [Prevotella intermedia]
MAFIATKLQPTEQRSYDDWEQLRYGKSLYSATFSMVSKLKETKRRYSLDNTTNRLGNSVKAVCC